MMSVVSFEDSFLTPCKLEPTCAMSKERHNFLIKMYTCFSKKQKTTHRLYENLEIAMESVAYQAVGQTI